MSEKNELIEQLKMMADLAPCGIGLFDMETSRPIFFNKAYYDLVGYTREEYVQVNGDSSFLMFPSDLHITQENADEYRQTGKVSESEYRIVRKEGQIRWVKLEIATVHIGEKVCAFTTFTDITREKEAALRAKRDEQRFKLVVDEMNAVVFEWNFESGEFYSSPAYQKYAFSQVSTDDILNNRGPADVVHPEDREEMQAFFDQTAEGKERVEVTLRLKMMDQTFRWCRMIGLYQKNENGEPSHTIGMIIDENEEHQKQVQLQRLVDEVPTGIGIYEIVDGRVSLNYLNDAYYAQIGATREQRMQYYGTDGLEAVHVDDRDIMRNGIRNLLEGEQRQDMLHRVRKQDGDWIWLKLTAFVVERKKRYLKVYAAFHDCNEMIYTQQELKNSRTRLQAAVACAKVLEWKYDYGRETVTDSGTLGDQYHLPKVIENIPKWLAACVRKKYVHESSVRDFWWMHEHCKDGRTIERELRYIAPDRMKYMWLKVIFSPIESITGNNTEVICTAVDITEQKEREIAYEEQLRLKEVTAQDALATANYNLSQNRVMKVDGAVEIVCGIKPGDQVDHALQIIRKKLINDSEEERFSSVKNCKKILQMYTDGMTHFDVRHQLKSDNRWVQTSLDIVVNPYTREVEAITMMRDISEQVRAELVIDKLLTMEYQMIVTIDAATGHLVPLQHVNMRTNSQELQETQQYFGDRLSIIKAQLEKTAIYETLYSRKQNGKVIRERAMYAYLEKNKTTILCAIQDVTDTFEQEERQKEELAAALHTAEEANLSKTEFFSRMSHDMRTPMNGILGLADLSLNETDAGILLSNIAQMKESGTYLLSLINDTLDFQKIESGKMKLNNQIVYTKTVFESLLAMIMPSMEEKNIQFTVNNHNADMDWYIEIDPVRIKQIFVNLFSNAVKFTPQNGTIMMEIENLSREGMCSHNCIKVIDSGVGMSRDFLEHHLFRPFEQEQNEVTGQYAGSGLGLSIVKSLVSLMGGHVEVESELGEGTVFSAYLDFQRVDRAEAERMLKEEWKRDSGEERILQDKKVLLVEDHPLNAKIAQKLLEQEGCKVHWENNGEKGLRAFADSAEGEYDVILMDIRMPVMDGLETTRAIRRLARRDAGRVPIIAMTANAYEEDIRKSMEAGMNSHLSKPIEPKKMYETMVKFLPKD